jgi:predicted nucleic acid-binding protein
MKNTVPNVAIDTNVLVYASIPESPQFENCNALLKQADSGKIDLFIADKTLYEFYAVISKTVLKDNLPKAIEVFNFYLNLDNYTLIQAKSTTPRNVSNLIQQTQGFGKYVHDLVLATIMIDNDVHNLVTYNTKDFESIMGLQVFTPEEFI